MFIPANLLRRHMARLTVVGLGPVGLVTAAAFALEQHRVAGVEIDPDRLARVGQGMSPVY